MSFKTIVNIKGHKMDISSIDEIRVLMPTNTQVRRLGYIVQICRLLENVYLTMPELQNQLETWAGKNKSALTRYISDKGVIQRSTYSLGSKRYIELAQAFQFVTPVSGYLRLTKTGRILSTLYTNSVAEDNPFEIESKSKLLFCYQLFLMDADYIIPFLELISVYHRQGQILENTQQQLLNRFRKLESATDFPLLRSSARERFLSISQWTRPEKYSEHLVLPRLHWLLDLGFVDKNTFQALGQFIPSEVGYHFLEHMPIVNEQRVVTRSWCQNTLFAIWAEGSKLPIVLWCQLSTGQQRALIDELVSLGFSFFRTMEYPRISAYQLVLFAILYLIYDKQTLATFEETKKALGDFAQERHPEWNFFWSAHDDDGYLLLSG